MKAGAEAPRELRFARRARRLAAEWNDFLALLA
jgi:hypothetical protein